MAGDTYCVKCKAKTGNKGKGDEKTTSYTTKSGKSVKRKMLINICSKCGTKKTQFVSA